MAKVLSLPSPVLNQKLGHLYYANGNMKYVPAKEGKVTYNYLNLPEKFDLGTQGKIYNHHFLRMQ